MEKTPLTRRGFLRLCMVAAGSVVASSCQKALQTLTPEVVPTGTASPMPSVRLNLMGGNVDAWTWVKRIRVGVSEGECEKVLLHAGGQDFEALAEEEIFAADVKLSDGENQVSASCLQVGGGEILSEAAVYTERLRLVPTAVIQITLENGQVVLDGSKS